MTEHTITEQKSDTVLGLDMGGTHTDAVIVKANRLQAWVKVPTNSANMLESIRQALQGVLEQSGIAPGSVCRATFGTTLAVNAVVQGRCAPVGVVLSAGSGMAPTWFGLGEHVFVMQGALDHRGEECVPPDLESLRRQIERWRAYGIEHFACVGKFSIRNPRHEQAMGRVIHEVFADQGTAPVVVLGHQLSGQLNFPRRIATAYWNAAVCRLHKAFADAVEASLHELGITAPAYFLKADGGTLSVQASRERPVEALSSGASASIMGLLAQRGVLAQRGLLEDAVRTVEDVRTVSTASDVSVEHKLAEAPSVNASGFGVQNKRHTDTRSSAQHDACLDEDSVLLDIGGTTTDIALFAGGMPLLAPEDLVVQGRSTLVHALHSVSIGLGGDSALILQQDADGKTQLGVAAERHGSAMAFGGTEPTFLDCLNVLGLASAGDQRASERGLERLSAVYGEAWGLEVSPQILANQAVEHAKERLATAVSALLEALNSQPVYTLARLLEDRPFRPVRAYLAGAPAHALESVVASALAMPAVSVPAPYNGITNAIGAALARPTAALDLFADTMTGRLLMPSLGIERRIDRRYSLEEARIEAVDKLRQSQGEDEVQTIDIVEAQALATLDAFGHGGKDIRVRCQIRPCVTPLMG